MEYHQDPVHNKRSGFFNYRDEIAEGFYTEPYIY